jgi:hypothetical protein
MVAVRSVRPVPEIPFRGMAYRQFLLVILTEIGLFTLFTLGGVLGAEATGETSGNDAAGKLEYSAWRNRPNAVPLSYLWRERLGENLRPIFTIC